MFDFIFLKIIDCLELISRAFSMCVLFSIFKILKNQSDGQS